MKKPALLAVSFLIMATLLSSCKKEEDNTVPNAEFVNTWKRNEPSVVLMLQFKDNGTFEISKSIGGGSYDDMYEGTYTKTTTQFGITYTWPSGDACDGGPVGTYKYTITGNTLKVTLESDACTYTIGGDRSGTYVGDWTKSN